MVVNDDNEKLFGEVPQNRRRSVKQFTNKDLEVELKKNKYYLVAQGRKEGTAEHFDIQNIDIQGLVKQTDLIDHFAPDQYADYWDIQPQQAFRWSTGDQDHVKTANLNPSKDPEIYNTAPDIDLIFADKRINIHDPLAEETQADINEQKGVIYVYFRPVLESKLVIAKGLSI